MKNGEQYVIDPRMRRSPGAQLAPRIGSLEGKRVALLDNGKVRPEFGHLEALFDELCDRLVASRVESVATERAELLHFDAPEIQLLASDISSRVDGVIIGVADTGVSAPSIMLAAALEALGIPTTVICQGIGQSVSQVMAGQLVPGVPLVVLDTWRLSSYEDVRSASTTIWSEVVNALTKDRAEFERTYEEDGSTPAAMGPIGLPSGDINTWFTDAMREDGYGDGMPLIAPTLTKVESMLTAMGVEDGGTVIWDPIPPRAVPVLAQDVAALAVMAGCSHEVGRIVLTAFQCMAEPEFRLFQAAITTHPSGTLVFVSGPETEAVGIASGYGCLGPGNYANAAVGRAVALSYSFLLGMRPGAGDLSLQGSPAEYSYCAAENLSESPWEGINNDYSAANGTTVTVLKCEGPHNVLDNTSTTAESLLTSVADTASSLGGNNLYNQRAQTVVFLNPEHAHIVAQSGWSKHDAQMFLFETARRRKSDLVGRGIVTQWDPWVGECVPIARTPEDILIVVAGAPGPQSQVAIPWGYSRGVTRTVE